MFESATRRGSTRSADEQLAGVLLDGTGLDEVLDELLVTEPGADLVMVLEGIRDEPMTADERDRYLLCWERCTAWCQLRRGEAAVGAAQAHEAVQGPIAVEDLGAAQVALVTGQSTRSAASDLSVTRAILAGLPGVRSALERGEISWPMARCVATATEHLDLWQRDQVDARMVASWEIDRDAATWRRTLDRAVLSVDGDAERRRQRAVATRCVRMWKLPDGMAAIYAELRAQDAATVLAALTAIADRYGEADRAELAAGFPGLAQSGDGAAGPIEDGSERHEGDEGRHDGLDQQPWLRSLDARRADALVDLCAAQLADPTLPRRHGRRATVNATGGIRTLLGLRDDPGHLDGYGAITAAHLREIAADADWRRFCLAEDTGALIGIGAASYRPRQALRDFLVASRPTCDGPGCSVPSTRCDADHTIDHHAGGRTDEVNVRPRCRRHHRAKTHAGWDAEMRADRATKWTSPSGTTRTIAPYRLAGDDEDSDGDHDADSDVSAAR
ncbi:MAG TPA: DUF222 domain-containing protein [Mycobacteriales bacterium]|nr:DUF222 domain-containing protein [Mycobacteriales bacterium]